MDRCIKNRSVHDQLGKRVVDQNWVDYEEMMKTSMFGKKDNGVQEVWIESRREEYNAWGIEN
jgi:hypothetical protein